MRNVNVGCFCGEGSFECLERLQLTIDAIAIAIAIAIYAMHLLRSYD